MPVLKLKLVTKQYFLLVLFIMMYRTALKFEFICQLTGDFNVKFITRPVTSVVLDTMLYAQEKIYSFSVEVQNIFFKLAFFYININFCHLLNITRTTQWFHLDKLKGRWQRFLVQSTFLLEKSFSIVDIRFYVTGLF